MSITPETLEIPTTTLRDGTPFPLIGLGTSSLKGVECATAVSDALRLGYRLVDTASQYGNEAAVGEGLRVSGVDRAEVVLTTKVAGGDQGREASREGVLTSLRRLGVEYVDVVLIHWPNPSRGLATDTWRTLLDLRDEGLVRHVGVSNFRPEQIDSLVKETGETPEINQIQLSPALPRQTSVAYHRDHGIVTEAWGPLGGREDLPQQFAIRRVAAKHGVDPARIALRWAIDQDIVVIPKSNDPARRRTNADLAQITLDDEDRALLASLDLGESAAWDSREHEEW
ncbi:aldo/keto reductase [Brachybacterium sp. EF45031]|uniref:aldo/keto reductase n=1 Tax=Brachybacterium sillae TaxID=2810536 RepID=UPI00217DBA1E|nr:aldo/keto reductase [Brachybacterium sillae]MCS6712553.1 aldo/keto reductase [Brachybacterium sillae]